MQGSARIDELRQKFHENPRRYFAPLANEYRKAGDPEQAIAICRAHLAQQPAHMSGHVVYAQSLYDAGRFDESRVVFEKALSLDPDNAIVLRQLGDISRQKGDAPEARHWYTRAIDADPHNREIAAYIAELTEPLTDVEPSGATPEPLVPSTPDALPEPASELETPPAEEIDTPVEEIPVAPPEEIAGVPAEEIDVAPAEEIDVAPTEEVAAAPAEEIDVAPAEEIAPALSEYMFAIPEVEIEIPRTEEPPALADMPGFEVDEALLASDADVELFPDSSSPFITRTMADLYARQGYNDQALEVYKKLAADNPHDEGIADRIRELSPDDSAVKETTTDAPSTAGSTEKPLHFSDTDLGPGDEWDADAWAAGFSSEEVAPLDFATATPPLGVFNDAREEDLHADVYRPGDEPEPAVPAADPLAGSEAQPDESPTESEEPEVAKVEEVEEIWRPVEEPELEPEEEPLYALPEDDSPYAEPEAPAYAEREHFVAYSPQLPEDEDLPHYTPVGPTIREFFAVLGAYRPPANGAASFTARAAVPEIDAEPPSYEPGDPTTDEDSTEIAATHPQAADEFPLVSDAFANLFPDSPVSDEDSRAAFALSGALSSQPIQPVTPSYVSPPAVPAREAAAQPGATRESEEDIRKFREWLDGLADS